MEQERRRTKRGVSGKGKAQRRVLWFGAVLLAAIVLVGAARVPIMREVASFLIVEDSLKPAAAIVALGGQAPFRQIEAARLYHAGWAPLVFVVQEGPSDEAEALRELGIQVVPEWELSRQVLLRRGVPASAIIVPEGKSSGTLEELQAVYAALRLERCSGDSCDFEISHAPDAAHMGLCDPAVIRKRSSALPSAIRSTQNAGGTSGGSSYPSCGNILASSITMRGFLLGHRESLAGSKN